VKQKFDHFENLIAESNFGPIVAQAKAKVMATAVE